MTPLGSNLRKDSIPGYTHLVPLSENKIWSRGRAENTSGQNGTEFAQADFGWESKLNRALRKEQIPELSCRVLYYFVPF